jgi:hypothetical protein
MLNKSIEREREREEEEEHCDGEVGQGHCWSHNQEVSHKKLTARHPNTHRKKRPAIIIVFYF